MASKTVELVTLVETETTLEIKIMSKIVQNVVAMSTAAKTFFGDEAASFSALNKGGEVTQASQREIADAMVEFITATRYVKRETPVMVEETNEQGETILVDSGEVELVEVDAFGEVVESVLAGRLTTSRANSGTAKIKSLVEELAAMKAKFAALGVA